MSTLTLSPSFRSNDQVTVFNKTLNSDKLALYVTGGSGSGKSYAIGMAAAVACIVHENLVVTIIKTDLKRAKDIFIPPIKDILIKTFGLVESHSMKRNNSFFIESGRSIHFYNGSVINLEVIDRPRPFSDSGDNKFHGFGSNLIVLDEISDIHYSWFQYFLFSGRLKSKAGSEGYSNKIICTENQSAFGWGYKFFDKKINPETLRPLEESEEIDGKRIDERMESVRVEVWNDVTKTKRELDLLKSGGNAARFFYSVADDSIDDRLIYRYETKNYKEQVYNIYALDPGFRAATAILQLGFSPFRKKEVHVKELTYEKNLSNNDIVKEIENLIFNHEKRFLDSIKGMSELDKIIMQGVKKPYWFLSKPVLIIDSARPDLKKDIEETYKGRIDVVLAKKPEKKFMNIENAKRLKIFISEDSRFLLNEINNYKYKNSTEYDERIPDGEDDALDAMLYGMGAINEVIDNKYLAEQSRVIVNRNLFNIKEYEDMEVA